MRITAFILLVLLWKCSISQDTCLPRYNLPVKFITTGTKMAYVEKGKGRPVVFIHGLGGNLSHWLKTLESLSRDFKCIAIDLPGYGYSDKITTNVDDYMQLYATKVASLIKKKRLKKVVLVGHSMGGQIAAILALKHPGLVSKLVLVAPAGLETFTEGEAKALLNATPAVYFEKQTEANIRASYKMNFFKQPEDAEQLIADRLRLKLCPDFKLYAEAISNGVKGMLSHPVANDLSKLKMPVLLIFGNEDALIPNKYLHPNLKREDLISYLQKAIPHLVTKNVDEAGHLVQFEKPTDVAKNIKQFLQ